MHTMDLQEDIDTFIHDANTKYRKQFVLNTMTLLIATNLPPFDLSTLIALSNDDCFKLYTRLLNVNTQVKATKKKNNFPNCIIYQHENVAVKVFTNGNIHMTGTKNLLDAQQIALAHLKLIKHVLDFPMTYQPKVRHIEIQMINSSFKLGKHVLMDALAQVMAKPNAYSSIIYSATYEKTDHPALNIKLHNVTTCKKSTFLLFRTGSVILTGIASIEDLKFVFEKSLELMHYFSRYLIEPPPKPVGPIEKKKRGRKRKDDFYKNFVL